MSFTQNITEIKVSRDLTAIGIRVLTVTTLKKKKKKKKKTTFTSLYYGLFRRKE